MRVFIDLWPFQTNRGHFVDNLGNFIDNRGILDESSQGANSSLCFQCCLVEVFHIVLLITGFLLFSIDF